MDLQLLILARRGGSKRVTGSLFWKQTHGIQSKQLKLYLSFYKLSRYIKIIIKYNFVLCLGREFTRSLQKNLKACPPRPLTTPIQWLHAVETRNIHTLPMSDPKQAYQMHMVFLFVRCDSLRLRFDMSYVVTIYIYILYIDINMNIWSTVYFNVKWLPWIWSSFYHLHVTVLGVGCFHTGICRISGSVSNNSHQGHLILIIQGTMKIPVTQLHSEWLPAMNGGTVVFFTCGIVWLTKMAWNRIIPWRFVSQRFFCFCQLYFFEANTRLLETSGFFMGFSTLNSFLKGSLEYIWAIYYKFLI